MVTLKIRYLDLAPVGKFRLFQTKATQHQISTVGLLQ